MKRKLTFLIVIICIFATACTKMSSSMPIIPIPEGVFEEPSSNLTKIAVNKNNIVFDGVVTESEYGISMPVNLSSGATRMGVSLSVLERELMLGVLCEDESILINIPGMNDKWAPSDGLNVYCDGAGSSFNAITSHVKKLIIIPDGGFTLRNGVNDGTWAPVWESFGIQSKGFVLEGKYMFEMRIPFDALGITSASSMAVAIELRETSGGDVYYSGMEGVDVARPSTWCHLEL